MDSSPSDLTLDYTPNGGTAAAGAYPMPKQQAAPAPPVVDDGAHHHLTAEQATTHKVQEFLSRLEEERLKIDAFKRELPLCMQLLNQAMEAYRQQLEAYQMGSHGAGAAAARPLVLEEFIPLKNIGMDAAEKAAGNATSEKASWMVSAQLWNGPAGDTAAAKGPQTPKERSEHPLDTSPMLGALDGGGAGGGRGNGTGAFLPFTKDKAMSEGAALPELALAPAEKDAIVVAAAEVDKKPLYHDAGGNNGAVARRDHVQNGAPPASTAPEGQAVPPPPQQTHRKARRCWSPELHRRFVNALQILGGAQVATPKQIRELMKVDGLTNDEVKSHLQKYRLHTRRPMPAPQAPTAGAPQLVVLGGIWMPPDYAAQAAGPAMYGAHPATQAHYTAAVSAQEYYQSAAAAHHLQHHQAAAMAVHRAVAPPPPPPPAYKTASSRGVSGTSPESEGRGSGGGGGGRERSESIDEEGEDREEDDDDDEDDDDVNGMAAANAGAEEINATAAGAGSIKY